MSRGIIVPRGITYPRAAEVYIREIERTEEIRPAQAYYDSRQPTDVFSIEDPRIHEGIIGEEKLSERMRAYRKALAIQKNHNSKDRRRG